MDNEQTSDRSSYEKLKDLILHGHIEPGKRMTEAFLSEKLDVSRIPIREAIQQLVHEGFIERTEKNGYQIKEYNEQDVIDLYNYREALDGMLARLFTQRMDDSQLYFLEMNLKAMEKQLSTFNQDDFSRIDLEFHRIIARGARNQYMAQQHEIILQKVLYIADCVYRIDEEKKTDFINEKSYTETFNQHKSIYEAIKGRNPDRAEQAARESVQQGLKKSLMILSRRF